MDPTGFDLIVIFREWLIEQEIFHMIILLKLKFMVSNETDGNFFSLNNSIYCI